MTWKRLAIRTLVATIICFGILGMTAQIAIVPKFGEGYGIPPESLRYRMGVWLGQVGTPVMYLICWPAFLALAFGVPESRPLFWIGFVIVGLSWVLFLGLCHGSAEAREVSRDTTTAASG